MLAKEDIMRCTESENSLLTLDLWSPDTSQIILHVGAKNSEKNSEMKEG
jgi:hypothetical protein